MEWKQNFIDNLPPALGTRIHSLGANCRSRFLTTQTGFGNLTPATPPPYLFRTLGIDKQFGPSILNPFLLYDHEFGGGGLTAVEDDFANGRDPEWLVWCDNLLNRLVPEDMTRPASSRQGQLLVAAFTLAWEVRNAGANWEEKREQFVACEEFVVRHLCDGALGDRVAVFVRETFAHMHRWMDRESKDYTGLYEAMNRVDELAYHWCRLHPEPIAPEEVPWEFPEAPDTEPDAAPNPADT